MNNSSNQATIEKSIFLAASPQTIWAFLTDKDKLGTWFHPAQSDLALGQEFSLMSTNDDGEQSKVCWGTVLEMTAPTHLVYDFTIGPLGGHMTTVTWTLEEKTVNGATCTKLSLTHTGLDKAAGDMAMNLLLALDNGWDKHLASMREKLTSTQ